MKSCSFRHILLIVVSLSVPSLLSAQCPMCRLAAEKNLELGGTMGLGLNTGILFLLAMPYALVLFFAFLLWRKNRRRNSSSVRPPINEA